MLRYVRRASPLHATRAGVGALWCTALAGAVFAIEHPVTLAVLAVAVGLAAWGAAVPREVGRLAALALPLALVFALFNPIVARQGVTVLARLGEVPPFGQIDLTLEALVWGALFGARIVLVFACFALLTFAVDPDGLLRAFRRVSLRSALAASLAVRLVPILARDGRRMAEAHRLRLVAPQGRRGQVAILRAVTTGALDRAMDVAATLEVRGYGAGRRPPRGAHPWSRHDIAFGVSTAAIALASVAIAASGAVTFEAYPRLDGAGAGEALAVGALLATLTLLPFADRRGIDA